jgi:hypothetical protein
MISVLEVKVLPKKEYFRYCIIFDAGDTMPAIENMIQLFQEHNLPFNGDAILLLTLQQMLNDFLANMDISFDQIATLDIEDMAIDNMGRTTFKLKVRDEDIATLIRLSA